MLPEQTVAEPSLWCALGAICSSVVFVADSSSSFCTGSHVDDDWPHRGSFRFEIVKFASPNWTCQATNQLAGVVSPLERNHMVLVRVEQNLQKYPEIRCRVGTDRAAF